MNKREDIIRAAIQKVSNEIGGGTLDLESIIRSAVEAASTDGFDRGYDEGRKVVGKNSK